MAKKMAAVNMMIHGAMGEVVWKDGVAPAFSTNDTLRSIGIAYGVSPTFSTKSPLIFFCFPQTI